MAVLAVLSIGGAAVFAAWTRADDATGGQRAAEAPSTTAKTGDTIPQQAPTSAPEAGPPATDLEPQMIGTAEDPVPLGEAYVLGVYEVTVNSADLAAADTLAAHDGHNPEPPPGQTHVLVDVTLRYVESEGFADTSYVPFDLRSQNDVWSDLDAACGNVPDSILDGVLLGPGDEIDGNVCFTVPEARTGDVLLTTEGFDGPVYFALR